MIQDKGMFIRNMNPRGGDKNLDDTILQAKILNQIHSNSIKKIDYPDEKREHDSEIIKLYKKDGIEIIFSEYVFPLVADCSMSYCPHGGSATGYIFINKIKPEKYMQFECPRDGYFEVWSPNMDKLIEAILSDEHNYIKII